MVIVWLALGAILTLPLLLIAKRINKTLWPHIFGVSLLVAALIYIGFALAWGTTEWLFVEILGVAIYGLFYMLAVRHTIVWLSAGWLLHPIWDVALHLLGPGTHIVPFWYAVACVSFDLVIASFLVIEARHIKNAHNNKFNRGLGLRRAH
ncbi:MAG: hypothetical protein COB20_08075 [SAR86 cluster bacterium]|uniref:Integral membrane protein n=1 Tax=SAR86 cluster bacterium TaxID=2030880 RepID=A0A2A4X5Y0_9GAMM|nr:MAG: hypothetical protein COB20_08075 [SAR86 cluster bacterium]